MNLFKTSNGNTGLRLKAAMLATLSLATLTSHAEERLAYINAGSQVFSNVLVTSVTATDVYFNHSGGMGNVKLGQLDTTLQRRFNYNATNAATAAKAQADASKRYYMAKAAEKPPVPVRNTEPNPQHERPIGIFRERISANRFLGMTPPALVVEKWLTPPADTTGKFVLIDFWATWCGPCRQVIPKLNDLQARFADKLVVIGISSESEAKVRQMTDPKIEYAEAIDTRSRTVSAVGVTGIPHVMIMDPKGIVRFEGNPGSLSVAELNFIFKTFAD